MTVRGGRGLAPPKRIFYASGGDADLVGSYASWAAGEDDPGQVSITFSGQIQQFIRDIGGEALLVSTRGDGGRLQDGAFRIEHRSRRTANGLGFHLEALRYCWELVSAARRFGADVALVDSGVTHFFLLALFPLMGIPVVPILHNALWPSGFRPTFLVQRAVLVLDGWFWRRFPKAVVVVSPEIERQVRALAGRMRAPIQQMRPQFRRDYFAAIRPVDAAARPFRATFVGRLDASKGALDVPAMAAHVEQRAPGLVRWTVCGDGPDLERLRAMVSARGLEEAVEVRGWTSPAQLRQVYGDSHVSVVPTRSSFAEGLAMTAAEAILSGRPLVSNPVVPALEVLAPAALRAIPDDPASHADAVLALATDPALYARLAAACPSLAEQFYDRSRGLTAVLGDILGTPCLQGAAPGS